MSVPNMLAAGGDVGMFSLMKRWQDFLEVSGKASDVTRRQYRRYLIAFLADTLTDIRELTEDDVVAWLSGKDPRGEMRGMTLRALRSFYSWAEDRELCVNPVKRLRVKKRKYGPAPTLSREELAALLAAAERVDPRARWALQLAYATGARVGSLCAVAPSDIDLDSGWITFRVAKGDRPYGVPLGEKGREAATRLLQLMDYKPPTAAARRPTLVGVGPGQVWNWAKRAGASAGVACWPHLLRHTTITRLAEANVDVRTIIELANWQDGTLLRRYAAPSDPNLRAAVEAL